jgi:DNA mismatch endonuclease (patch repair protein)
MRAVRSRWTRQERLFASLCSGWERGTREEGNADFAFRLARVLVFLDGDFWHGRRVPDTLPARWAEKLNRNRDRDRRVRAALESGGWEVVSIWESDFLSDPAGWVDDVMSRVESREEEARLWGTFC